MATTTNFGWETPDDSDLVKDGALAIRTLGSAIDSTVYNIAQTIGNWKSGRYYRNGNEGANHVQTNAAHVSLVPFIIPNDVTLASVSVQVSDSATATSYLGVYSANATTGLPDTLITSFGSFSGSSAGVKTIATTQAFTPGVYWFAVKLNQISSYAVTDAQVEFDYAKTAPFGGLVASVANGFTVKVNAAACLTYLQTASGALEATAGTYVNNTNDQPLIVLAVA